MLVYKDGILLVLVVMEDLEMLQVLDITPPLVYTLTQYLVIHGCTWWKDIKLVKGIISNSTLLGIEYGAINGVNKEVSPVARKIKQPLLTCQEH